MHQHVMRSPRRFGLDALTRKWNSLNRLLQLCGNESEGAREIGKA